MNHRAPRLYKRPVTRLTIQTLAMLSVVAAGCKGDKKDKPAGDGTGDTGGSGDTARPADAAPAPSAITRLFACDFVAWDGEGDERQARFALVNKGKKPVKRLQTWIYYYKKGEQIDRYPHALAQTFEPGARVEQKLGAKGTKIKKETEAAACEVTEATYTDGEVWSNLNLNYNPLMIPRPLDGETHEQLLARTGTAVKATWKGNLDGQATFELENVKGEPLEVRTVWVYYYDVDGRQLGRAVSNLMLKLDAGARVEQAVGYDGDKIPEHTRVIEATISRVDLAGGKPWINRNLAPFDKPMDAELPSDDSDAGAKPE